MYSIGDRKYFKRYIFLDTVRQLLPKIQKPPDDRIAHKHECMLSFDNPDSPTGLYVSLSTFMGFGENYVHYYVLKTDDRIFLHIKHNKSPTSEETKIDTENNNIEEVNIYDKIRSMALRIYRGDLPSMAPVDLDKYNATYKFRVVVLPEMESIDYPDSELQHIINCQVKTILNRTSVLDHLMEIMRLDVGAIVNENEISKYPEAINQENNGKHVTPHNLRCEICRITYDLWLNLTDGAVLCGAEGENHAMDHYNSTDYPLVVNLSTIRQNSNYPPEVYSYPEQKFIYHNFLRKHLLHFGIRLAPSVQADAEEIINNELRWRLNEWCTLTEAENEFLEQVEEPPYTGINNLGNTSYMNVILQLMFIIPNFIERYSGEGAEAIVHDYFRDSILDFNIQMAKLGNGLISGRYSTTGISPISFKYVFSQIFTRYQLHDQHDPYQFYMDLLTQINKSTRGSPVPSNSLKITFEEEYNLIEDPNSQLSKNVSSTKILTTNDYCLCLDIPWQRISKYGNKSQENVGRPKLSLETCLENYFKANIVENFHLDDTDATTGRALKTVLISELPEFLMIQLRRFITYDDWTTDKNDTPVHVPNILDLGPYRTLSNAISSSAYPDEIEMDENLLNELKVFGYSEDACKRACYNTKNSGVETACAWLLAHKNDEDFNVPFEWPQTVRKSTPLSKSKLGSSAHADHKVNSQYSRSLNQNRKNHFRPCEYKLIGLVSHMGSAVCLGHYVCHIEKDNKWLLYNDDKIYKSENVPIDSGYMYMYQRMHCVE